MDPPTASGGQASASCPRGPLTGEVTYVRDGDTIRQHSTIGFARLWWDELQHGIRGDTSNGFIDYLDRYTAGATTVGNVVQDLCATAGLQPSDLDVTEPPLQS